MKLIINKQKTLKESVYVYKNLKDFEPWGKAIYLWDEINKKGLMGDFELVLDDIFTKKYISEETLNDLLIEDEDYIREELHL